MKIKSFLIVLFFAVLGLFTSKFYTADRRDTVAQIEKFAKTRVRNKPPVTADSFWKLYDLDQPLKTFPFNSEHTAHAIAGLHKLPACLRHNQCPQVFFKNEKRKDQGLSLLLRALRYLEMHGPRDYNLYSKLPLKQLFLLLSIQHDEIQMRSLSLILEKDDSHFVFFRLFDYLPYISQQKKEDYKKQLIRASAGSPAKKNFLKSQLP